MPTPAAPAVPRLTYLRIKNYRALRDVEFRDLTPLTVLIGPNGSGKSTVLDALDFLAEAVRGNLVGAWEKRDRFRGMRTRGSEGPVEFEVRIQISRKEHLYYSISIDEANGKVRVFSEELVLERVKVKRVLFHGELLNKNDYKEDFPETERRFYTVQRNMRAGSHKEQLFWNNDPTSAKIPREQEEASSYSILHLSYLTIALEMDRVRNKTAEESTRNFSTKSDFVFLREVLISYRLLHLTDDHLKGYSDAGPREKLSPNGDNLPNVLYYLHEKHPEVLEKITTQLRRWVPQLADVVPEITSDERLLLRFKDAAFEKPLPAQYMSGGTMRLAALLTLLYEPSATGLLGIEEPENELHPQLLPYLAEELIAASEQRQLLVATHSPALLNALEPEQVWILHRGPDGYTQATRAADLPGIPAMVEEGSPLGYLWSRNFFDVGSPLDSPLTTK